MPYKMKMFVKPIELQSPPGHSRSNSRIRSMFLMFFFGWLLAVSFPLLVLASDDAMKAQASQDTAVLAQVQLRERIREKIRAGSTSDDRENAMDVQTESSTAALKNALLDRLQSSAGDSDALESGEEDGGEEADDAELLAISTDEQQATSEAGAPAAWLQLSSQQKISFDCFTKPMNVCEAQYCTWVDGACSISPGAYKTLCEFYCDESICIQPPPNAPPGSVVCPVRPKFLRNLCGTMKDPDFCRMQSGMCAWNSHKKRCEATPTCCSRAQTYCSHKRWRKNLVLALHACRGFATRSNLCAFWHQECTST